MVNAGLDLADQMRAIVMAIGGKSTPMRAWDEVGAIARLGARYLIAIEINAEGINIFNINLIWSDVDIDWFLVIKFKI